VESPLRRPMLFLPLSLALAPSAYALSRPQDEGAVVAGVGDAADAAELIPAAAAGLPPILPGHEPGARGPADAAAATAASSEGSAREWFGHLPWTSWQRSTGDWAGARSALETAGIDFNGSIVSEWSDVFSGGEGDASAFRHLVDLNVAFDLGTLVGLERASVFVDFQTGDTGVGGLLHGGYQAYSNIALDGSITQVSQLWYEQWFAGDAVRIKVGKVDANAEFAYISSAGGFIHASAGFTPAIIAFPTYPNPAFGVNLFVYPCEGAYVGAAVYDGSATVDGQRSGALGPGDFLGDDQSDDWFVIGEAGYTIAALGPLDSTRFALGAWWHSGDFATFSGGTEDGTSGFYALAETRAWRPAGASQADADDTRGLWFFLQYGGADPSVSAVERQFGAGVSLEGTFAHRDGDSLGAYLSVVDFTDEPAAALGDSEWSLELYYDIEVTHGVHLKPDLQWYVNPAGGGDDALVGTLRVTIAF